jgi:hypothetical protein
MRFGGNRCAASARIAAESSVVENLRWYAGPVQFPAFYGSLTQGPTAVGRRDVPLAR